jgi:hypothetical protein
MLKNFASTRIETPPVLEPFHLPRKHGVILAKPHSKFCFVALRTPLPNALSLYDSYYYFLIDVCLK